MDKPAKRKGKKSGKQLKCGCTTPGWPNVRGHDANCPLNTYTAYANKHGISRFEAMIELDGM